MKRIYLVGIALMVLLALALTATPSARMQEPDPGRPVWYRWYLSGNPKSMQGTLGWNSGDSSGYLEIEQLWHGDERYLIEVGTSIIGTTDKLFMYIATYEGSHDYTWEWTRYYDAWRKYHTFWVNTEWLSATSYLVQVYDCNTDEMMVSTVLNARYGVWTDRLADVDYALEYDRADYNANGTIALQKLDGANWTEHTFIDHGWIEGWEPHDRMHGTVTFDPMLGCSGPATTVYKQSTDGVDGPPPMPLDKKPLVDYRAVSVNTPLLTPTPVGDVFLYFPMVGRNAGAVRALFNGWWE